MDQTWRLEAWSDPDRRTIKVTVDPSEVRGATNRFGSALLVTFEPDHYAGKFSETELLTIGGTILPSDGHFGGITIPQQPVLVNGAIMQVPLSPHEVTALDASREGGDLVLYIRLTGTARLAGTDGQVVKPVSNTSGTGQVLTIPRETWLQALEQMGGRRIDLIELSIPETPHEDAWAECVRQMNRANGSLARGELESSVQSARIVVEGIVDVLASAWAIPKRKPFDSWVAEVSGRMSAAWPQDDESARMLGSLLQAAWAWTSPSHHFGSAVPARAEAAFAASLAAQLLQFISFVHASHPGPPAPATESDAVGPDSEPGSSVVPAT